MVRYPYAEWPLSIEFSVANAPTADGYQVMLTVPWRAGMQRDFRDLRFRDPATLKKCAYWIESKTDGASAVVWVRIFQYQKRLSLLYGNNAAVSESSGNDVFDLFDDFLGTGIDASKWDTYGPPSVSGGIVTVAAAAASIRSKSTWGVGYACLGAIDLQRTASTGYYPLFGWSPTSNSAGTPLATFQAGYPNANSHTARAYVSGATNTNLGGTYSGTCIWDIARYGSTTARYSVNHGVAATHTTQVPSGALSVVIEKAGNAGVANALGDWVAVRKCAATEPVLTRTSSGLNPWSITVTRRKVFDIGTPPSGPTYSETGEATLLYSGTASSLAAFRQTGAATLRYSGAATARIYVDFMDQRVEALSVRRNISEVLWRAEATINGIAPVSHDVLRQVNIDIPDHTGALQRVFYGVAPNNLITQQPAKNKTKVTCYDYGWHLTQRVVPVTLRSIPAATPPEAAVAALLGGADWEKETGVQPYLMVPATAWGTTVTPRIMVFPRTTTRMAAIQAYCELLDYCFFVLLRTGDDGRTIPSGYFIPEDQIDTVLDLPDPITITNPAPYLDGSPATIDQRGDEKYNRVIVEGMTAAGLALIAVAETADVTAGEEIPLEYPDARTDWDTQEKVDARAAELLEYFQNEGQAYRCTFVKRSDLRLFQKIKFVGWANIPEVWMRIVDIEYRYTPAKVLVVISFSPNLKMSEVRRLLRSMNPTQVGEIENLINNKFASVQGNRMGTVTAISENTATVTLDTGETIEGMIR